MAAAHAGWVELQQLLAERYPDLPHHEAYLEYLHDVFIRFPTQFRRLVTNASPNLSQHCPQFMEAIQDLRDGRPFAALGRMLGLGGIGRANAQSAETNRLLGTIASELKTFNNPSLIGQISNIGGILTGAAAVYYIKKMADQVERIANGLERIGDHIRSENIRGDKFPGHSTEWQPKFDDINRNDPLGPHYLGYSHDLDELVDFLAGTARPQLGPEAIFHILIPVVSQVAITESLTFPDEMGPFRVSGQLSESGLPSVYLCMPLQKDCANFRRIGSLRPRPRWVLLQQAGLCVPILDRWLSTILEPVYFDNPPFAITTTVGTPLYRSLYTECDPVPPRKLGTRRTT